MRLATLTSSLLLMAAVGCASKGTSEQKKLSANDKITQWLVGVDENVTPVPYKVEPPDVLTIMAPQIRELNDQTRTVGPDGKISLNLVGSIDAMGRTTDDIAEDIRKAASKYYAKDALDGVRVRVAEYKSKFIYVFGQVNNTGKVPWTGRDSLVKIIAQAQLGEDAWPEKVVVVRPHDDPNVRQKITIDVATMYEKGDATQNILLEDGDVVYVPPTPLSRIALTFNKLLAPLIPASSLASIAIRGVP